MNALNLPNATPAAVALSNATRKGGYATQLSSAERMAVLHGLNGMVGYTAKKTILPEGTPLIAIGEENLARERVEMEARPKLRAFADAFLAAEDVRHVVDTPFKLADLTMLPTGKLQRRRADGSLGPAVATTPTGLAQLVGLHREALELPSGFAGTLAWALQGTEADRADAAQLFNQLSRRAAQAASANDNPLTSVRIARVAHRLDTLEPYIFAVTSKKHVGVAGGFAAVVRQLMTSVGHMDARVRVTHQGHDRLDIEILFPMLNREIAVGDLLWGAIGLTLSESKDNAASVWDALMRALCSNLTKAYYGANTDFTRKHVGAENFAADLMARIAGGAKRIEPFVRAFGDSYSDTLPVQANGRDITRAQVVERAVKAMPELKALPAESLLAAWDLDGSRSAGNTRGGLVNAMTRASQTLGISDADLVEKAAGRITFEGWSAVGFSA